MTAKTQIPTDQPPHPSILPADAPKPDEGGFWVIYGRGGVGKTTSACLATAALLLDCTGAGRYQHIDTWRVVTASDLKAAVDYLKVPGHPYRVAILDSLDDLYERTLPGGKDDRARHKATLGIMLPSLAAFWSLPMHRVLILNERRRLREVTVTDANGNETRKVIIDIEMNLPPRLNQIIDDRADVVMRGENSGKIDLQGAPLLTRVRIRRITDSDINIQAKSRLDTLTNGMDLIAALNALGVIISDAD